MHRKEFLSLLGLSASAALVTCIGCSKDSTTANSTTAPAGIDFSLDLTQTANAALQTNGGYLYHNGVIVAKTMSGNYIAVQQICTHEQFSVVYEGSRQRFYCGGHGATFSETGTVTGGPAPRSLQQYNTQLTGNSLRVYSA